jgi:hypothetical protein
MASTANPIGGGDTSRLVETPIDRTLSKIEEIKNTYWDNKVAMFGFAYRNAKLTVDESASYAQAVKAALYSARWILEVISSKINENDVEKHTRINKFLTNYQISSGANEELFAKLREFDNFIAPYIDHWKHDEIGLMMLGGEK